MSAVALARRCWAEIDLEALRHNAGVVRARIGPDSRIMAIVKAGGYGHGAIRVVRALQDLVQAFGVANVYEGVEIREAFPGVRIDLLGPALPEEMKEVVERGFVAPVSSMEEAAAYSGLSGTVLPEVCLAIDTGMGRIGVWEDDAIDFVRAVARLPLKITGIASHLPVADQDDAFTLDQLKRFRGLVEKLADEGFSFPVVHSLNSAGILQFPGACGNMVRAGLMLYGSSPIPECQKELRPVLAFKARVTLIRDVPAGRSISYGRTYITPGPMKIATVSAGYADGYRRHLSGVGAEVLIGGQRCAVLGRVTMDQIMADVTALPDVAAGDEVVLIGSQGRAEIQAAELAGKAGTIAWEIFTGLGQRVERIDLHPDSSS